MSTAAEVRIRRGPVTRKAQAIVDRAKEAAATMDNRMFGEMYAYAVERRAYHGDSSLLEFMSKLEQPPVDIETFIDSPEFLGATDLSLWPEVRTAVIDINRDWWKGTRCPTAHAEAVLAGGTGTGKSEISKVTLLYHLHILFCLRVPQEVYGLPKTTSIVFAIQAAKPHVTKKVLYMPLRKMVEDIPFFQKHARLNKLIESEMYFEDKNIRVVPGGSDADSILGEAIIGGIIDEINFMNIVLKSKRAEVTSGRAGVFDQAQSIHDAMTKRKKGRFTSQGPLIGIVCTSSSTRFKGDFTDKRIEQVKNFNEKNVYIYRKAQYEVVPQSRFCGEKFRVLVGNDVLQDTRVLKDDDRVPEGSLVLDVPVEYKDAFLRDPHGSLRDICGISTNSISPFFRRRFKIQECVQLGTENGLESFLTNDNVILGVEGLPIVKPGHYCTNPSRPRYVHVDLSITGDRAGVAMVRYDGMMQIERDSGVIEKLPVGTLEMAFSVEPDANSEIDIAELRTWVKVLKDKYGYPIKVVTYDGYQSKESMQQWKKQGMRTGMVSVDRTSVPYKQFRDAINDGRIALLDQPVLIDELFNLEYDETKDRVDHPVNGCFTGDTLLRMPDGSTVSFGDAATFGKDIPIVTYSNGHDVSVGEHPRITKYVKDIVEVTLENGRAVRCTPEHLFLLKSGEYKQAQYLTEDDDLQD